MKRFAPALIVATALAAAAQPAGAVTRYSLVHGCYRLQLSSGKRLGPYRMQAAALGQYLLYNGRFLGSNLKLSGAPSVWTVGSGARTLRIGHKTLRVRFLAAKGCPRYPEAQVDAFGTPFTGPSAAAGVLGTAEGHAHITAFELFGGDWHCGRPFSPFGAPYALPASCASDEQGTNGEVEAFEDFGSATRPSDMHGWPTFKEWPSPTALAEEGDYWTGIERAWMAGLRLIVTNNVDNEALCKLMTKRSHACNDMLSVRLQAHDLYALQNYIDAQSGGPGRGFFRIVTDPFQARRVINQGKLAVIEGIEVSRLFGCGEFKGKPQCDEKQVDSGLNEVRKLGVRTFFPVHEFNNAFGGTKMLTGETGMIVNAGNFEETGSFWTLRPCPARDADAQQMTFPATGALAQLLNGPVASLTGGTPVPLYQSGPQCNVQGLTALGAYLIHKMIKQHLILQTDHMDSKTATAAVAIAERAHYAGVVSAHCCSNPQLFSRIYNLGGAIDAPKDAALAYVSTWKQDRALRNPRYFFGFGYGSDMNGLSGQVGPDPAHAVRYPFKSPDGRVTFTREVWGKRTFDLNKDGMANYGMYADWLKQVEQVGGPAFTKDMFNGAEAYLEMWERADGVPAEHCLTRAQASRIHSGESFESVLFAAGQPLSRPGSTYRYCAAGRTRGLTVAFNRAGRVARVVG